MDSPDQVCSEYYDKKAKISLNQLDENTIIVQGDKNSLEFLGKLLIAQANFEKDDGFQISPNGAGKALFETDSKFGIYIKRL